MGWTGGALGQQGDGITEPVGIRIKRDNKGLGASERDDISGEGKERVCFIKSKME